MRFAIMHWRGFHMLSALVVLVCFPWLIASCHHTLRFRAFRAWSPASGGKNDLGEGGDALEINLKANS